MKTRTFRYIGDAKAIRVGYALLEKGSTFSTDDPRLIAQLTALTLDIEEVKETAAAPEKGKKTSRPTDAVES